MKTVEEIKQYRKEYNRKYNLLYKENRIKISNMSYIEHKRWENELLKKYKNKDKIKRNKKNLYRKKKYETDPLFKLSLLLRTRIIKALKVKSWNKANTTADILGCDFETVKLHLEKQFVDGMNWDNHGLFGWHIDHIIPLASATTEKELLKLCHYTNLQPLWAEDNLKKSDKLNY